MQQRYPGSPGPSPDDDVQVSENGTDPLEQLLPSIRKFGGGCGRHLFFSMKNLHTYGLVIVMHRYGI